MARNASVLSKAGLLSSTRATDNEKHFDGHNDSTRQSTLLGTDTATDSPVSPVGGPFEVQRRNSRPMVYDQRLNPAAIMQNWQANSSRNSVGTMQDQRDYSRPLGVTNPDPEPHDY
ncbi:hypothetical protein M8818_005767 [Zalaria obscura]|uniref:Uncharacterized protein n=1 Tax=Zalaria obscura TaxID=2024903 RepID=A0ACC3SC34_9PEZI